MTKIFLTYALVRSLFFLGVVAANQSLTRASYETHMYAVFTYSRELFAVDDFAGVLRTDTARANKRKQIEKEVNKFAFEFEKPPQHKQQN